VRLSDWSAQGDWRLYFLDRDRIEQVTPEQVKAVAARYLTPSNRTIGLFTPTATPERTPIPATPEIAGMVEGYKGRDTATAGEQFDVAPASIEARVQRPAPIEGVKIALLPKKNHNEAVHLVLHLRYGDPESLKGMVEAAEFLPELMLRGTKQLSRQQIQDTLNRYRARLSTGGGGGGGGRRGGGGPGGGPGQLALSIETQRGSLPAAIEVLRQVLREPTLPADEFETLKTERLARLEQARTDPMRLSAIRLQRLLANYAPTDIRYTPTIDEQIDRLKATRIDQVKTLYNDFLGAGQGELVVVGDFEPSEILPILARTLESWKAKKPYARIERAYQPDLRAERQAILTPDKANAVYVAGLTLPLRDDHPDYPALIMGNFILGGGGLSSRLADRLRQREGLCYSVASNFTADDLDTIARLQVFAICNPANASKVETGATEELAKLVREGVSPDELERARSGYLQQQQVMLTNDPALAGILAKYLHDGRTMKYMEDMDEHVRQLTPEAIAAALRKHIHPDRLSSVSAGDLKPTGPAADR